MTFEDEMRAAMATFVIEARELLQDMETGLLGLEHESEPAETVNAIFRAAHTIKGSSGLFGLDHLVRFTHVLESVLDRLRNDEIAVSADLVGALLPCCDHLGRLMDAVEAGRLEEDPVLGAEGDALRARLEPYLSDDAGAGPIGFDAASDGAVDAAAQEVRPAGATHLSLRFGADCLRNGMDPLSFIRYLSTIGVVRSVRVLDGLLPAAADLDPEVSYLDFEITLETTADADSVADVFEFVRADSEITVLPAGSPAADYAALVTGSGEIADQVAEVLVSSGAIAATALAEALALAGSTVTGSLGAAAAAGDVTSSAPRAVLTPDAAAAIAALPVQSRRADVVRAAQQPPPAPPATGTGPVPTAPAIGREARSLRVDAGRLDRLIDVVGELVIAGAGAGLHATSNGDETLLASIGELMRLVEEVRDSALQLRMVPIGTTFSRFQRVVRDVGADLGKDVALVISGGETEVDKALVEQIGDPLMHLVRNSMDHGIEPAEVRVAGGKPARGTLRLNAFHDSGSIVIEVTDDGGGIDPQKVLAKAVERGLVEAGATPSEQDIYQLVFEPGFSTADAVSDLSGRGVGMDVVKRNVTALRGSIDVESVLGQGCTMRIRLPLTLAIIDGFLVGVGGSSYVVPLDRVIECVELPPGSDRRDCMDLRGEVLPFIRLRSLFAVADERPRRENVVVVEYSGSKVGLVVDTLMGEFQTVIKPLGQLFSHVNGIGGATILGNGDVALIIDVSMLVRHHGERQADRELVTGR